MALIGSHSLLNRGAVLVGTEERNEEHQDNLRSSPDSKRAPAGYESRALLLSLSTSMPALNDNMNI